MKEYSFSEQFTLISLDGIDCLHPSVFKNAVFRGISASRLIQRLMDKTAPEHQEEFMTLFRSELSKIRQMKKKAVKELEAEVTAPLKAAGVLEIVPDLLGCDINYYTSGVELNAYRCDGEIHLKITEWLRSEILEEGPVSDDCFFFLWLLRETGCIHNIFSTEEQSVITARIIELTADNPLYLAVWNEEFHSNLENTVETFLKTKKKMFSNPYLEGVNLMFPFLDRRQAIFIDYVILGTNVAERRLAMLTFLTEKGHYVDEVKRGSETLLKIDNTYYRVFPGTVICSRIPIQGSYLIPVYK